MRTCLLALCLLVALPCFAQRILLTSNQSLYVNCATGNDSYAGTLNAPFLTRLRAYQYDQQNWDHAGQYVTTVTLQTTCTTPEFTTAIGPLFGAQGPQSFVFAGTWMWGTTVYGPAGGYVFQAQADAAFTVTGVLCYPGAGGGCYLANNSVITISNVGFVMNGGNSLGDASGPRAVLNVGNIGLASGGGNVNIAFVSEDRAQINLGGAANCAGAPTWTTSFVQGDLGGIIDATGFTYHDCPYATGKRYNVSQNGIVFTGGSGGLYFFPGSSAGTVFSGGYYQ